MQLSVLRMFSDSPVKVNVVCETTNASEMNEYKGT